MERKDVYLDDKALEHVEQIIKTGWVNSLSAAVRFALAQAAPRATPTTP